MLELARAITLQAQAIDRLALSMSEQEQDSPEPSVTLGLNGKPIR